MAKEKKDNKSKGKEVEKSNDEVKSAQNGQTPDPTKVVKALGGVDIPEIPDPDLVNPPSINNADADNPDEDIENQPPVPPEALKVEEVTKPNYRWFRGKKVPLK